MTKMPENGSHQLSLQKSVQPLRALKGATETANSNEIWLLTLSDLLMLLMIFFVFLLAAPLVQASKSSPSAPATTAATVAATRPAAAEPVVPIEAPQSPDLSDQQAVADLESDLQRVLGGQASDSGVTVERRSQFLVITFPEQILFDSGQAQMKTAAGATLEKVAAFIAFHPKLSVEIQGHTDDRPIRSPRYPSNWELSADRATQVAKTLVGLGADPKQLATKGFGEYHPIASNDTDADRLKNRRVEIQFSLPQS